MPLISFIYKLFIYSFVIGCVLGLMERIFYKPPAEEVEAAAPEFEEYTEKSSNTGRKTRNKQDVVEHSSTKALSEHFKHEGVKFDELSKEDIQEWEELMDLQNEASEVRKESEGLSLFADVLNEEVTDKDITDIF